MESHPLPALRYRANRETDKPFERVADEVEAAVLRRGVADEDGGLVIDAFGAAMVEADVRRALDRSRVERAAIVLAAERDAGRLGEQTA